MIIDAQHRHECEMAAATFADTLHEVSVMLQRSERLGKRWKDAEGGGK